MKHADVAELLASRRQRLFAVLLQLTIVVGPVALVPGVYAALRAGLWAVVVVLSEQNVPVVLFRLPMV